MQNAIGNSAPIFSFRELLFLECAILCLLFSNNQKTMLQFKKNKPFLLLLISNGFAIVFSRRESGNCRICWSADAATDVGVSGKPMTAAGVILVRKFLFA